MKLIVNKINFHKGNYYIASCTEYGSKQSYGVKIYSDFIEPGCIIHCHEYSIDKNRYGETVIPKTFTILEETDDVWAERFLVDNIYGIGKKKAAYLSKYFNNELYDILNNSPEKLLAVNGITEDIVDEIKTKIAYEEDKRLLSKEIEDMGLSPSLAKFIVSIFGERAMEVIYTDPYLILEKNSSFDINICEYLFINHSERSYKNKLLHLINLKILEASENGNTSIIRTELTKSMFQYGYNTESFDYFFNQLIEEHTLYLINDKVASSYFYNLSTQIIDSITRILADKSDSFIKSTRIITPSFFNNEQKKAVIGSLTNKVSVITGVAGTGKTTTLRCIVDNLMDMGISFLMASPTAMAAKRMTQATNQPSQTIHKLLEYDHLSNNFQKNRYDPLPASFIIIDEASMANESLFRDLLDAIPSSSHLIILGDYRQLPSVEAGQVLKDIIHCGKIPVFELTELKRTGNNSDISLVANDILNYKIPNIANNKDDDVFFFEHTGQNALGFIKFLVEKKIKDSFGVEPKDDLQVLSPVKKGELGINNLNCLIQNIYFDSNRDKYLEYKGMKFYVGDYVIMTRNDYNNGVLNGEQGKIIKIENNSLFIQFEEIVEYSDSDLNDLLLSYAKTVHKSQGQEYPIVIIALPEKVDFMVYNELLYTAITRGSSKVIIVGKRDTFYSGIMRKGSDRVTILGDILKDRVS